MLRLDCFPAEFSNPMYSETREIRGEVLFIILSMFVLSVTVSADSLYVYCLNGTGGNYTINSPFETNLRLLLQSLPSNTSLNGFNDTYIGDIPDRIYGQALCRGDVNSIDCRNCIVNASQEVLKKCNTKEAIIWYEFCQIHYSLQDFISLMVYTGRFPPWNDQEKNISDPAQFREVLKYLISNLSVGAAFDPSGRFFATGEVIFSREETIYGLVQCTRDISNSSCLSCLNSALTELVGCCSSRQGGMVLSRNCVMRFESYRFYNASSNLLTYPTFKDNKWKTWMVVLLICLPTLAVVVLIVASVVCLSQKTGAKRVDKISQNALLHELASPPGVSITEEGNLVSSEEHPFMDLATIRVATDNFSDSNKLGQGGFGTVYKGLLQDGKEVAVKRLSRKSWQGFDELKNEIILIAKLQHRNLVRLLGCAIEGEEKMLIYEFMPNKSLDILIFDSKRREELDWKTCYSIIGGIARGLLYLHEDSRLKIIHRDLKPSNVLLDHEMVAKISDFGMARIFGETQNAAHTRRVVGTYGYMAPEYAMEGLFSVKSDVFSFGVILLEMISGKRNSGFYLTGLAQTLLAYAWRLWNEGKEMEFADPWLMESSQTSEVLRCMHIGLLCVQEDPADRPTMSSVVLLLGSEPIDLPMPRQPAFSVGRAVPVDQSSTTSPSANEITHSSISPR